jgi:hypothetical protein
MFAKLRHRNCSGSEYRELWIPVGFNYLPNPLGAVASVLTPNQQLEEVTVHDVDGGYLVSVSVATPDGQQHTYLALDRRLCPHCGTQNVHYDMVREDWICYGAHQRPPCGHNGRPSVSSIGFQEASEQSTPMPFAEVQRFLLKLQEQIRAARRGRSKECLGAALPEMPFDSAPTCCA